MSESSSHSSDEIVSPPFSLELSSPVDSELTVKRMSAFSLILSAVLLSANAFVCATWSHFFEIPGWMAWQALPGVVALAFIPATIFRFRSSHPTLRIVYAISAAWLGGLNFAFFAALSCWVVEWGYGLTGGSVTPFPLAATLFGLAGMAFVYGLINSRWIRVTKITVQLAHLPEAWKGRSAALLTDLHLGPLLGAGFLRRVIARLRSVQPDIVFISGDMFDGSPLHLDQLVAPWSEFSAPRGIYYVTGNHDEFAERNLYLDSAKRTGIHILNNEKIDVEGLQIVGVHDSEAMDSAQLREILWQVKIDRLNPSILLAHRPVNLSVAEEAGISLQLSGHTHGGQIWPWNLVVSLIYGRFASGLSRLHQLQI
ncbi:MAG: metallophosphoesterase, partial [Verrucomicrobiota bacterium]